MSLIAALARGIACLKTAQSHGHDQIPHCDELPLCTFIVSGVPPTHAHRVTLQAMLLEELDRVKSLAVARGLPPLNPLSVPARS